MKISFSKCKSYNDITKYVDYVTKTLDTLVSKNKISKPKANYTYRKLLKLAEKKELEISLHNLDYDVCPNVSYSINLINNDFSKK